MEVELEDWKGCIIQEHIHGFQKRVRHATFFCQDIDAANPRFDVNKDVVHDQLINEVESSPEEQAKTTIADDDINAGEAVEGDNNKAA